MHHRLDQRRERAAMRLRYAAFQRVLERSEGLFEPTPGNFEIKRLSPFREDDSHRRAKGFESRDLFNHAGRLGQHRQILIILNSEIEQELLFKDFREIQMLQ